MKTSFKSEKPPTCTTRSSRRLEAAAMNETVEQVTTPDHSYHLYSDSISPRTKPCRPQESVRVLPFLDKTYRMIDTCPQEIAGWNNTGESFIIYQPKRFAMEIIPKFFKHRNFSSFVRQLNFYGFRKTKASSVSAKRARKAMASGYCKEEDREFWEFIHDKFRRGRFELMGSIRRKSSIHGVPPLPPKQHHLGHHHGGLNNTSSSSTKLQIMDMNGVQNELQSLRNELTILKNTMSSLLESGVLNMHENKCDEYGMPMVESFDFGDILLDSSIDPLLPLTGSSLPLPKF